MGYVSRHDHALLDFRLSLPKAWARDEQRRQACHVPREVRYTHATSSVWRCLMYGVLRCLTAGSQATRNWVTIRGSATHSESGVSALCWACPAPPQCETSKRHRPRIKDVDVGPKHRGNRCERGAQRLACMGMDAPDGTRR
jgi:hypothetical protein